MTLDDKNSTLSDHFSAYGTVKHLEAIADENPKLAHAILNESPDAPELLRKHVSTRLDQLKQRLSPPAKKYKGEFGRETIDKVKSLLGDH